VLGALLATSVIAVLIVLQLDKSTYTEICSISEHTGHKDCATYSVPLFLLVKVGKLLDASAAAITAIATGVIAYFTWTIWNINRNQLEHNQRVERAHVSVRHNPNCTRF
jgi:hypothetical protein